MNIVTKRVTGIIEDVESSSGPGEFSVKLTTPDLDRDGDELFGADWETPLPNRIQFNTDHDHKVASTVGSAIPELVGDDIVCRGTYASTEHAQTTRTLVKEGHVPHVSVAYREKKDATGHVTRELINGSFVVVPANPKAVVLSSKSLGTDEATGELTDEAKAFIKSIVDEALTAKGADGKTPVSEELPAPDSPSPEADPSADQDREKALALGRARLSQFQTKSIAAEGI